MMKLASEINDIVQPLFDIHPMDGSMLELVVKSEPIAEHVKLVENLCESPELAERPALQAGLWLYIDDLERSHRISQKIDTPTGAFWHAIMHRREGDFSNSHHWYNVTGSHPALAELPGYDPHAFVDEVALRHDEKPSVLIETQQHEWQTLFAWCSANV